ncbi:MAG: hypothetical protein MUQ32_08875, partial [Chloroflexi bacterium]|nr:hypothetical protein [Chloroflexota bacterium]
SYYPTLKRLGILEPVAATYHEINADLTEIAGRAGIPTIAAYTAFGGPEGDADPVAAGYVEAASENHPTDKGSDVLAQLIRALGYETEAN